LPIQGYTGNFGCEKIIIFEFRNKTFALTSRLIHNFSLNRQTYSNYSIEQEAQLWQW